MKKGILGLLVLFTLSCSDKANNEFEKLNELSWLIGKWENKLNDGTIIEKWEKKNDSTFIGKSFYIKGKDTLHSESIVVSQLNSELIYSSKVVGQDFNESIDFVLNNDQKEAFVFENATHEYPQKIEYKKLSDNQLSAKVSGIQFGKQTSDTYILNKK